MSGEWSTGLCGCFSDCGILCKSCWCPCLQVGENAEFFGEDKTTACCMSCWCGCPYHFITRNRVRTAINAPGTMLNDMLLSSCCKTCSIAQEGREIKAMKEKGTEVVVTAQPTKAEEAMA